jgi:amidohydrolase
MNTRIPAEILATSSSIAEIRRQIHAHPELCFDEINTSEVIAAKLTEWGIPVHRGLGKTGVVGTIKKGSSARAIGLRADMDALPIQEMNQFEHASKIPGRMHGCGHDGHTAMLLSAAQYLAKHGNFDGTVQVIFQPAEEGGGGGREMIKDGLFKLFPVDAVFGMHNFHDLDVGKFSVSPGPVLSTTGKFKVVIRGKGGHAALPHDGVDPIVIGAGLVQAFQTIVSRSKDPTTAGVISVTMFHAGDAINVIPETCEISGSARAFSYEVLDMFEKRLGELAHNICAAHGAECNFEFRRNYPPTINSAAEAEFARTVMVSLVGEENVQPQIPTLGAEDFGFMLQEKPGAYCFIGNGDGNHRARGHGLGACVLHNASYDFNDEIIPMGSSYWVRLSERWLSVGAAE